VVSGGRLTEAIGVVGVRYCLNFLANPVHYARGVRQSEMNGVCAASEGGVSAAAVAARRKERLVSMKRGFYEPTTRLSTSSHARGEHLGFSLKTSETILILRYRIRKDLQRDFAGWPRISTLAIGRTA
jgi:hypothetical protein